MVDIKKDCVCLAERKGVEEPLKQAEMGFLFPVWCVRSVDVSVHAKPDTWKVIALF